MKRTLYTEPKEPEAISSSKTNSSSGSPSLHFQVRSSSSTSNLLVMDEEMSERVDTPGQHRWDWHWRDACLEHDSTASLCVQLSQFRYFYQLNLPLTEFKMPLCIACKLTNGLSVCSKKILPTRVYFIVNANKGNAKMNKQLSGAHPVRKGTRSCREIPIEQGKAKLILQIFHSVPQRFYQSPIMS